MRVAVYMRVGCAECAAETLANQEKQLRVFADANWMDVAGAFKDVGSGLNFERPGWRKLMAELSKSHYDALLVKDFSRIGRDMMPTLDAIEMVERKGVKLLCLDGGQQNLDSTRSYMRGLAQQFENGKKKRKFT